MAALLLLPPDDEDELCFRFRSGLTFSIMTDSSTPDDVIVVGVMILALDEGGSDFSEAIIFSVAEEEEEMERASWNTC